MPQGDPWAIWAMAIILTPVIAKLEVACPDVKQFAFADDRSMRAKSLEALHNCLQKWETFSGVTDITRNVSKDQLWPMSRAAAAHMDTCGVSYAKEGQVLGVYLSADAMRHG